MTHYTLWQRAPTLAAATFEQYGTPVLKETSKTRFFQEGDI